MINPETIEQVRELSIYDVVNHYVLDLKKSGANWTAKSPFSNEKSPSFFVVPAKNIFKCFSSGKGGDGITFVMQKEGLSYVDAIKDICAKFNIRVQYDSTGITPEEIDQIELLYKINHATARQYAKRLLEVDATHPAFKELINKRRFSPDTIAQWQIGYAPGEVSGSFTPGKWNFLSEKLIQRGYYAQGIDLGLIKTKESVNYDVFRHRITYPIVDHHGRFCGFGARALQSDQFNAKYLNSADSKIFNKSKILFGLHFASGAIRKKGYANLMEGYTDVISFHQAGQINSVGTCGTSLTEEQTKLLRKYTNKVVLFYDPDEAGQNAAARSIDILMRNGFQSSVVPMPSVVQLKRDKPNAQPWRETVFITQRNKDSFLCKHGTAEIEIDYSQVDVIEKVDPDELVRMF
jgi:DNA primase